MGSQAMDGARFGYAKARTGPGRDPATNLGGSGMELNKTLLDCMQALRRRLRDELAMDIRLSQSDAVIALLGGCLQSSDEETRRLGQRLAELTDQPPPAKPVAGVQGPLATPRGSVRIYRGQRIYA